jgi:hypothetical protein
MTNNLYIHAVHDLYFIKNDKRRGEGGGLYGILEKDFFTHKNLAKI